MLRICGRRGGGEISDGVADQYGRLGVATDRLDRALHGAGVRFHQRWVAGITTFDVRDAASQSGALEISGYRWRRVVADECDRSVAETANIEKLVATRYRRRRFCCRQLGWLKGMLGHPDCWLPESSGVPQHVERIATAEDLGGNLDAEAPNLRCEILGNEMMSCPSGEDRTDGSVEVEQDVATGGEDAAEDGV